MKKELNRIAKIIARSGLCSRRDAEKKIESGEVNVNGEIIYSPALNVSSSDIILVNGKQINQTLQTKLFIYNKPVGLIHIKIHLGVLLYLKIFLKNLEDYFQ